MEQGFYVNVQHWTREMEKQVGDRLDIVMCNQLMLSVYQTFGGSVFRRSSVFHGLERFLREQNVRGKRCVEIGTWNGLTAIVLSQFFDEVVTLDIVSNPLKHEIIGHLGITNIRCIDIAGNEDKPSVIGGIKFDCAYMDGNHAEDTETDFDLVRNAGRVIFHEVWPFQSPVWSLVMHGLPQHQVSTGGCGLAFWDGSRKGPPAQ